MNLNELETQFFDLVLRAELDVPVRATLELKEDTLDIIVVPVITDEGYFKLKYFNALAWEPPTQIGKGGASFKRWGFDELFGKHPLLQQAWQRDDPVTLRLHASQSPNQGSSSPSLDARVLFAGIHHRGDLALNQNQVEIRDSRLRKAKFCILDFPDFVTPQKEWNSISGVYDPQIDQILKSVSSKLGGDAAIVVRPARRDVLLDSGHEWKIRLTKDEEQTRDLIGHTGVIERNDGSEFDASELSDVLDGIKCFCAFTAGASRHPTVVIGYDSTGNPIWGQIGLFDADQQHTTNWFNNSCTIPSGVTLECLFTGYWRKWSEMRDEITAVIECYAHSNTLVRAGAAKDAVAKSCAGLEILASLILGETIVGNPSEPIDNVLSNNEIPNRFLGESETPVLAKLTDDLQVRPAKGSDLLNKVRNYIVHPLDRNTKAEIKKLHLECLEVDPLRYVYLHDLSQFYLEYLFLKHCAYRPSEYRPLLEQIQ